LADKRLFFATKPGTVGAFLLGGVVISSLQLLVLSASTEKMFSLKCLTKKFNKQTLSEVKVSRECEIVSLVVECCAADVFLFVCEWFLQFLCSKLAVCYT
jgi:hypothetical protein